MCSLKESHSYFVILFVLFKILNSQPKCLVSYSLSMHELSEVALWVFVFCPLLLPSRGSRMQSLTSEYNLARLILRINCPSYLLTSDGKKNKDNKVFKYKCLNTTKRLILFQDAVTNFSPKYMSWMGKSICYSHHNKFSRPSASFQNGLS